MRTKLSVDRCSDVRCTKATYRLATMRRSRYVWGVESLWLQYCPIRNAKASSACWAEAPHRGAQSDVSTASTGRPEMAAQLTGFIPPRLKRFNDRFRLTAALGGVTRPASLSASIRSHGCAVDYRATASSEWPGKLPPADGAGVQSPHPPGQAGTFPRREAALGAGGRDLSSVGKWFNQ